MRKKPRAVCEATLARAMCRQEAAETQIGSTPTLVAWHGLAHRVWNTARIMNGSANPVIHLRKTRDTPLHSLRGWGHVTKNQVFPRSPRSGGSDGHRTRRRLRLPVGGDPLDCREDRLLS
jgi:hypothetical protein